MLFAFLFGYSFTLQMDAAERAGVPAVPRLMRRSAALFLVGVAHATLLWLGDILTAYAVLCAILVALRKIRARTALVNGLLLYTVFSLLPLVQGGTPGTLSTVPAPTSVSPAASPKPSPLRWRRPRTTCCRSGSSRACPRWACS
ncbi:hypothetical protein [Nocardia wallacei]|uniref:hypothetical protein n=1 Tax=Nocardia wallacei TaxID=480035 RepID=UPI0024542568|nr:hypothetical protein [Nocardia wallacei]